MILAAAEIQVPVAIRPVDFRHDAAHTNMLGPRRGLVPAVA